MVDSDRRSFLRAGALGLVAISLSRLTLPLHAQATPASGDADNAPPDGPVLGADAKATTDNIEGPYYRKGAPFRAKVTPPLEPGTVLVVRGRVWGLDTRKPLSGALVDIWQANAKGRYDNDDPAAPPKADVFANRVKLLSDETGLYEFESVHPGAYSRGGTRFRPPHIHFRITHPTYKTLITQLYFKDDPHQKGDQFIKDELIIPLTKIKAHGSEYEEGSFDIVLRAK